ncbi:acyl-CoA N-acyltransferase, partial [Chaetomium strumarium]
PHPGHFYTFSVFRDLKTMATTSRIRVREGTPADVDAIVDIYYKAFRDNVMDQLMYPGGPSEDARRKFTAKVLPRSTPEGEKGESLLCVAEYLPEGSPADGPWEVVAFGKWDLYREARTEEEWKADEFNATADTFGAGCDPSVINAFIGGMTRKQRDHAKGEAALFLGLLACSPARQGLGAGSALMKWGVDLADSLGLPCRLEASPAGYRLYKKFGFEDFDVLDLPVTEKWGVANTKGDNWGQDIAVGLAGRAPDGVHRCALMRRPPKSVKV